MFVTLPLLCFLSITNTFYSPLIGDALVSPPMGSYPPTSEYLVGSVAVSIITPESDGSIDPSSEDWTEDELATIIVEVSDALTWWSARDARAHLTFSTTLTRLPSSYEPITRPYSDEKLWIQELMAQLSCSESSYFSSVRCYDDSLREARGTDWAITIFVLDSSNDADGLLSDGAFAYAYLGGPFLVMTYDNANYGPQNMDAVAAHEIGHSFYALDQYYGAHVPCTARSGVLNVENQNSEYGDCLSDVPSVMRGGVWPFTTGALDWYARGQVGWRDSDCDGNLDPVDGEMGECLHLFLPVVLHHAGSHSQDATSRCRRDATRS